jgi:hypothetical protein
MKNPIEEDKKETNETEETKVIQIIDSINEYYNYIIKCSNDYDIEFKECDEIFMNVKDEYMVFMYKEIDDLINGVNFYCDIYEKIKEIMTLNDLEQVIKFFFIDNKNSKYMSSHYDLIGALMKINIHLIWKLSYKLHPRLRNTPEEALYDIINPLESSQKIFLEILDKLKNNKN